MVSVPFLTEAQNRLLQELYVAFKSEAAAGRLPLDEPAVANAVLDRHPEMTERELRPVLLVFDAMLNMAAAEHLVCCGFPAGSLSETVQ